MIFALSIMQEVVFMNKPIIGIPGNLCSDVTASFGSIEKNFVNKTYTDAISENGGVPLIIPCTNDFESLDGLLRLCDGFLFPGGEDVDPKLYNEGPHKFIGELKPYHDRFMMYVLKYAAKNCKPALGICKGMQLMAVYSKGSLYQDIFSQRNVDTYSHCQKGSRKYIIHSVTVKTDSLLYSAVKKEKLGVNSMHHQSVKSVGDNFKVTAYADDGIVEAIESTDSLFIGVQWHPEELFREHEEMADLFRYLINRSKGVL